jgi:hypothetical protein
VSRGVAGNSRAATVKPAAKGRAAGVGRLQRGDPVAGPAALEWVSYEVRALVARHPDGRRMLFVSTTRAEDLWIVVAVETGTPSTENVAVAVDAALAEHAHRNVGSFKTEPTARRAAERYARAWRRGRAGARCGCRDLPG